VGASYPIDGPTGNHADFAPKNGNRKQKNRISFLTGTESKLATNLGIAFIR
jgi:hypothetical protein